MSKNWNNANGGESKIVRWQEDASESVKEKTVYVGDTVQGIYEDKKEDVGVNKGTLYVINTEEHGLLSIWGQTVISSAFKEKPAPQIGDEVMITYLGKQETKDGKGSYINYDVKFREVENKMKSANKKVDDGSGGESGGRGGNDLPPM